MGQDVGFSAGASEQADSTFNNIVVETAVVTDDDFGPELLRLIIRDFDLRAAGVVRRAPDIPEILFEPIALSGDPGISSTELQTLQTELIDVIVEISKKGVSSIDELQDQFPQLHLLQRLDIDKIRGCYIADDRGENGAFLWCALSRDQDYDTSIDRVLRALEPRLRKWVRAGMMLQDGALRSLHICEALDDKSFALAVVDPDTGIVLEVNNTLAATVGYSRKKLAGESLVKTRVWRDEENYKNFLDTVKKDQNVLYFETEWRCSTARRWQKRLVQGALIKHRGNEAILISSFVYPSDAKVGADTHIFTRMFYSPVNANILSRATDGVIVDCNDAAATLAAIPRRDLIGQSLVTAGFITVEQRREAFKEIVNKGPGALIRDTFINKRGELTVVERTSAFVSLLGEDYLLTTFRDVTAMEQVSEILHFTENLAQIGGFHVETIAKRLKLTPGAHKIFQTDPNREPAVEEFRDYLRLIYTEDSAARLDEHREKLLRTGAGFDLELEANLPNGEHRWFRKIAQPLLEQNSNRICGYRGVVADITRRKLAEQQRHSYELRLKELAVERLDAERKERERIAANLHDTVIQDLATLQFKISRFSHRADNRDVVEELQEQTNAIIKRSRELLYEINPPILHDVGLDAALHWLGEQLEREGYTIVYDFRSSESVLDQDCRSLLYQCAVELANNVKKHAGASTIVFRTWANSTKSEYSIEVIDNGVGIDTRDPASENREGFGLFGIRTRVESLGGRLELNQTPGGGLAVRVMLPIQDNEGSVAEVGPTRVA